MSARIGCLFVALLTFVCGAADAIEIVHVIDGRTATVEISATQPTLIRVENGRLRSIRSEPQHVRVEADRGRGEAIVTVQPGAPASTTLLVSTERLSFPLVVRPVNRPTETIVLREQVTPPERAATTRTVPSAHPHVRQVKSLILAAASDQPRPEVQIWHINQPIRLWAEVRILHRRTLIAHGMQVDHWVLTNVTPSTVSLDEQELFARGVAAVAIERHHLMAGESTAAYIVRTMELEQ